MTVASRLPAVLAGPRPVSDSTRVRLIQADPICRVLAVLGPDFGAREWARRLDCDLGDVLVRAEWLGIRLGGA